MKKQKSEAQLQWEAEYREQRRQATWERAEEWLARNPMGLSSRAMAPHPSFEGQEVPKPQPGLSPFQPQP